MEERVTFSSDGLTLAGILHLPADRAGDQPGPAFLLLHGFGSNKQSASSVASAQHLARLGYAALRFDFRGCGESEGEPAFLLCQDQVRDTRNALSYLQTRPEIQPQRIGVIGQSFGAAVALFTGGVDERVAAVVSAGGWGNGERKFRAQHATPEAWARFQRLLHAGIGRRPEEGKGRLMVPRFDIVPIPERLRGNMAPGSIPAFPWETVQSMYDFCADDVVGQIAPRPLLLLHAAADSVTPTRESIELFLRAGQPTELHLLVDTDHFMSLTPPARAAAVLDTWLAQSFPASAPSSS